MLANSMANIEAQQKSDRNVQNLHHLSIGRPICAASALIIDDVGVTFVELDRSRKRCITLFECCNPRTDFLLIIIRAGIQQRNLLSITRIQRHLFQTRNLSLKNALRS